MLTSFRIPNISIPTDYSVFVFRSNKKNIKMKTIRMFFRFSSLGLSTVIALATPTQNRSLHRPLTGSPPRPPSAAAIHLVAGDVISGEHAALSLTSPWLRLLPTSVALDRSGSPLVWTPCPPPPLLSARCLLQEPCFPLSCSYQKNRGWRVPQQRTQRRPWAWRPRKRPWTWISVSRVKPWRIRRRRRWRRRQVSTRIRFSRTRPLRTGCTGNLQCFFVILRS